MLNGSPLFTGGAGSGESEIRRHVLENDFVEAIIALPTDMFFNTGIATYVWILSNRKPAHRRGVTQLIGASAMWSKMRESLGSKRKQMGDDLIDEVTRMLGAAAAARLASVTDAEGRVSRVVVGADAPPPAAPEGGAVKLTPLSLLFRNETFGYRTITVERPLRDGSGAAVLGQKGKAKGKPQPDSALRDTESVPLSEDVQAYFEREARRPSGWT